MTDQRPPQKRKRPDGARWSWQFTVAVVLLLGFAVLVAVMVVAAGAPDDKVWERRVYLFGAVEAIVFTAVGWLFGREVHRTAVDTAKQDAEGAREDAAAARDEAKQKADEAARAEQEAVEERTRARTVAAMIAHSEPTGAAASRGASQDAAAGGARADRPARTVVDLQALVRDLYGP